MSVVEYISIGFGLFGICFGLRCYRELYKWARQCQHARIAIAYKRRVQLQAPLVEWVKWCNQLDKDKDSHGRVVWRQGYASVAITKAVYPPGRFKTLIRKWRTRNVEQQPAREGSWSAQDETVKT